MNERFVVFLFFGGIPSSDIDKFVGHNLMLFSFGSIHFRSISHPKRAGFSRCTVLVLKEAGKENALLSLLPVLFSTKLDPYLTTAMD